MWQVTTTNVFDQWLTDLDDDAQAEIIAKVELLKALGPQLARPHADTLNGSKYSNMKELRGKTATTVLRVAFAFDPDRAAILLIGGDKSGINEKRFYKALIERADKLYSTHLDQLKLKRKGKE